MAKKASKKPMTGKAMKKTKGGAAAPLRFDAASMTKTAQVADTRQMETAMARPAAINTSALAKLPK